MSNTTDTKMNDTELKMSDTNPKKKAERVLIALTNTVCYLSYYYAKKDSTTMVSILNEDYSKIKQAALFAGYTQWKNKMKTVGIELIGGSPGPIKTSNKSTVLKGLLALAEFATANTDKYDFRFYPEFKDMDIVISNYDNTAVTRMLAAQKKKTEEVLENFNRMEKALKNQPVIAQAMNRSRSNTKKDKSKQSASTAGLQSNATTASSTVVATLQVPKANEQSRSRNTSLTAGAKRQRTDSTDSAPSAIQLANSERGENDEGTYKAVLSKNQKKKQKKNRENSRRRAPLFTGSGGSLKGSLSAAPKTNKSVMLNIDNQYSIQDLTDYVEKHDYLKNFASDIKFEQTLKTHNGFKVRATCTSWPASNTIAFCDPTLWPTGATIKNLKGIQRKIDPDPAQTGSRKFLKKFFSNLGPSQSVDGVKSHIERDFKDSDICNEEVEVHVEKYVGKTPYKNNKTAFIVVVVPKDPSKKIPDILLELYKPKPTFSFDDIRCRDWGGDLPGTLSEKVPVTEKKYAEMK